VLKEFRDFLFRGNIVELAIAFVMGVAFAAVVNSLVDNLVMPIVAMLIGKPDFGDLTFTINDAVFRYGAFLTDAIQFVAIAAAVFFFVVKPIQKMMARRHRTPVDEGMPDEERRHQELLAALHQVGSASAGGGTFGGP
jgi:large conductance mechanosensitive channel